MVEVMDIFLKSIERLDGLVRLRHDLNRTIFTDHVDPMYKDLALIVDDYHAILEDVRNVLQEFDFSKGSGSHIVSMLIKRRQEQEGRRQNLRRYSMSLKENNRRDDVQKFAAAVFNLLNIEPVSVEIIQNLAGRRTPRLSTATTALISDLTKISITPESQRRALILINHYKKKIDWHWDLVSQAYFDLRTKYLI